MELRYAIVWVVLSGLLLAGCTSTGKDAKPSASGAFQPPALQATSTTGVIRGVVVDDAIRPLANASVTARGAGMQRNTTTGADGFFGLQDLAPGSWFVSAHKAGYTDVQQSVEVRAGVGDPPVTKVQLVFVPGTAPFEETLQWDGFIECAATGANYCALPNIYTCVAPNPLCGGKYTNDDSVRLEYDSYVRNARVPDWGQWETYWDSTQSLTDYLCLRFGASDPTNITLGIRTTVWDTVCKGSPIVYSLNHTALAAANVGTKEGMNFEFFTGGQQTLCDAGLVCGAGATLEQRFTMLMFNFYGYTPPDGWSFAEAQAVPPPV